METVVNFKELGSYYKNKKVFVTGHTGFKGSWLICWLNMLGAEVKGYALEPSNENGLFNAIKSLDIIDSVIADIRNKQKLSEAIFSFQPDFIFHLAAQPLVRRSYEIPTETFEVNVIGTANVIDSFLLLEKNCTAVIITTDKVYENAERDVLYKETDRLGGYDPYSASKACSEILISSFRNSFIKSNRNNGYQKAIVTVRAGNVIGGGDWSRDRIIPDVVRALMSGQTIKVRNPVSVRPWQHVLEPLGGYLIAGKLINENPSQFSSAYNFGPVPDDHLTVGDLVNLCIEIWGMGQWENISDSGQPHEANLLKLDISRAMDELNWMPKLNSKEAVEWTINWYKQPPAKQVAYTFDQIKMYAAL